ncbi:hypothetical protein PIB30_041941 [Stylosanthes scabra]|uniref:Uncharacterized protein n=1 Tax=Stylosanthes scabra TaxID=79078 RepID=A0ABU6SFR8_9FABA|nr:hypothetical protein [Stylosanthes scabra]
MGMVQAQGVEGYWGTPATVVSTWCSLCVLGTQDAVGAPAMFLMTCASLKLRLGGCPTKFTLIVLGSWYDCIHEEFSGSREGGNRL